jgi:hypothetical protein
MHIQRTESGNWSGASNHIVAADWPMEMLWTIR